MYNIDLKYIVIYLICLTSALCLAQGGYHNIYSTYGTDDRNKANETETVIWCTVNKYEQKKCENFAHAIERDNIRVGYVYFKLVCKQAFNKDECMTLLDEEKVHLTGLDPGQVFIGGRYHSLVPIMQEINEDGFKHYYSVAVIKKETLRDVRSLSDLRGKKACFSEVGSLAGWVIPVHTLMSEGGMEIIDCNNHVKSTINFFGPSCAINSLIDKYNPIGDNSDLLCKLCIGKIPGGKCTSADPYAGFQGAFRCLLEAGEIAFVTHMTVEAMTQHDDEFTGVSKDSFELFCKDGTRRPISEYRSCNWGQVPTHAIVTTSAASFELRIRYQKFLEKAAELYSHKGNSTLRNKEDSWNRDQFENKDPYSNNRDPYNKNRDKYSDGSRFKRQQPDGDRYFGRDNRNQYDNDNRFGLPTNRDYFNRDFINNNTDFDRAEKTTTTESPLLYEKFDMFESIPKYGIQHNLLFEDSSNGVWSLPENQQTYSGYLDKSLDVIMNVRKCTVNRMTLCVTSDAEHEKCIKMRTAMKAQLLKPEMICYNGHSQMNCMQSIKSGLADVAMMDAGDIYTAGLTFDLVPIISEVYNLGKPEYYVVAVSKEDDPSTDLTYLKGKYTCHTGINTAAGWVYPMAYLLSNGWIRPYGCNSVRAAAEYFTKSCVPGALSTEYNTGLPYDNMCDLCHGTSFRYCRRDASEDYFGHTGAFRCLVEGGGDVAFVKHTTVMENTGGKRREWWVRDALPDDFELLCPDGTRAEVNEYERCNLGKVMANAVVTRGGYGYNETEINAFINLFVYAQQFYGRKDVNEFSFSMFYSLPPFSDLIFQDATQQLQIIEPEKREYSKYLGPDFMRAQRIVQCNSGASSISVQVLAFLISSILALLFWRE